MPDTTVSKPNKSLLKMKLMYWGALFAFVAVTALALYTNLSRNTAPLTPWQPAIGESALIDLGGVVELSAFQFYSGPNSKGIFMITASADGRAWRTLYHSLGDYSESQWHRVIFEEYTDVRYIEIIPFGTEGITIMEAGFRDEAGRLMTINHIADGAAHLFDEQHLIPLH